MNKLWMAIPVVVELAGCNGQSKPSVMIDSDSIGIGYTQYVQQELPDWYVAHNPGSHEGNGRSSAYAVEHLQEWLAEVGPTDVIHANWGLWDMFRANPGDNYPVACNLNWKPRTSLADYRANLEILAGIMEKTGSKIIWATTTPVPDSNECVRSADVPAYNSVLVEVAQEHGFTVDDLYAYVLPNAAQLHEPATGVHFSELGYQFLSYAVSQDIESVLKP